MEPKKARAQLEMSLDLIQGQLTRIAHIAKASATIPLDPEYMNALLGITKTLVLVDKNAKDYPDEDEDDLSGLSEEEMIERAREEIDKHDKAKKLKGKKK